MNEMDEKLPLLIFEDGLLIYANFSVTGIFDNHPIMLKGMPIEKMFTKATINAIEKVEFEKEININILNGMGYIAVVAKSTNVTVIRFLHPNKPIPHTPVNLKTSNHETYEFIMGFRRKKIEALISELEPFSEMEVYRELQYSFPKFCDDVADMICEIKTSREPAFEIFEICEIVKSVIEEAANEMQCKISMETLIENGYVTGDKEKLSSLLKEMLIPDCEIKISEDVRGIKIFVICCVDNSVEFSNEFSRAEAPYSWRIIANSAGCKLFSRNVLGRGRNSILFFRTKEVYKAFDWDLDIFIDEI